MQNAWGIQYIFNHFEYAVCTIFFSIEIFHSLIVYIYKFSIAINCSKISFLRLVILLFIQKHTHQQSLLAVLSFSGKRIKKLDTRTGCGSGLFLHNHYYSMRTNISFTYSNDTSAPAFHLHSKLPFHSIYQAHAVLLKTCF